MEGARGKELMRGELKKPPPVVVVVVAALFSFLNVIIPNFLSLETKNTRFGLVLYLYQFGIWRPLVRPSRVCSWGQCASFPLDRKSPQLILINGSVCRFN